MTVGCTQVSADKTFSDGEDGWYWEATDTVEFTVPVDKFLIGDELNIIRNTPNTVTIKADTGVTITAPGLTITRDKGFVRLIKMGTNMWIAYGDL